MAVRARISPAAKYRPRHMFGDAPNDIKDVRRCFSVIGSFCLVKRDGSNYYADVPHTLSSLLTAVASI